MSPLNPTPLVRTPYSGLRAAARRSILDAYDLETICLPAWLKLIDATAG